MDGIFPMWSGLFGGLILIGLVWGIVSVVWHWIDTGLARLQHALRQEGAGPWEESA